MMKAKVKCTFCDGEGTVPGGHPKSKYGLGSSERKVACNVCLGEGTRWMSEQLARDSGIEILEVK